MITCIECGSAAIQRRGVVNVSGEDRYRYKCNSCGENFYIPVTSYIIPVVEKEGQTFSVDSTKFVITSAQSNTDINKIFLKALETYCDFNDATLLIIPIKNLSEINSAYPSSISKYFIENNIKLHPKLKVLASLNISPSLEYPLSGLAPLSKGDSIIIGHNQLQMATLPVQPNDHPVIMTTTGTLSNRNYTETKQGYKADFNHAHAAVVVELDDDIFHIRHINFDGKGFYDFEKYYTSKILFPKNPVSAIVTGDEHVTFSDIDVREATYGEDGIVSLLKPTYLVRHDVLDCFSVSHHHKNNLLTKFKKWNDGTNIIHDELFETIKFIVDTTPTETTNIIVSSNHNDHLKKWLNECDIRHEPWNAITYHYLMFKMLSEVADGNEMPNPFELYSAEYFAKNNCDVDFIGRTKSFKLNDVELALHGDVGANGSKGNIKQFAGLPTKTIIGHSHSPGITHGAYQVGTSSTLQLEYNIGPSSWMNTHCILYANGKRQLINIINGRWRA
jgi:hypothetical protein